MNGWVILDKQLGHYHRGADRYVMVFPVRADCEFFIKTQLTFDKFEAVAVEIRS